MTSLRQSEKGKCVKVQENQPRGQYQNFAGKLPGNTWHYLWDKKWHLRTYYLMFARFSILRMVVFPLLCNEEMGEVEKAGAGSAASLAEPRAAATPDPLPL